MSALWQLMLYGWVFALGYCVCRFFEQQARRSLIAKYKSLLDKANKGYDLLSADYDELLADIRKAVDRKERYGDCIKSVRGGLSESD